MIHTVVERAVLKVLKSSAFQKEVEQAVHNWLLVSHAGNAVASRNIHTLVFTVPVALFLEQKVEK